LKNTAVFVSQQHQGQLDVVEDTECAKTSYSHNHKTKNQQALMFIFLYR